MTYRVIQWSTGNVGRHALRLHRSASRARARRAVGALAPTRPGKDAGELCGLAPTGVLATNDVDALLALDADCVCYTATADLRPTEAINDMARILGVGQERRVELGRAADLSAARRAAHARAARRRVRDRRACRASRRASIRAGRTTSCRSCSRARASTSTQLRVMEIVNYATTRSRRCCSTRWASARRSTRSRCC